MSDEEDEERRRRNQIIRSAASSNRVTVDEKSLLLDVALLDEAGAAVSWFERWRVRRIVGRVAAG